MGLTSLAVGAWAQQAAPATVAQASPVAQPQLNQIVDRAITSHPRSWPGTTTLCLRWKIRTLHVLAGVRR
nr:hypothetical protein [Comamonas jiangduensis]